MATSKCLQLVDDAQRFTSDLGKTLKQWNSIDECGFDYDIVAVFGSQSTGKSTLLNALFDTRFDVMDGMSRSQTTKGIWLGHAHNADHFQNPTKHPVLIMDVEGTDGRERGEDQDFERKSALFSLATASCLILNMWETQVGLYNGANLGLLKTVMEVNLSMFLRGNSTHGRNVGSSRGRQRTRLLFIIRDYTARTPAESLGATIRSDLERIWATLNKPEGLQSALLGDYFDLDFFALPHKLLQEEQFHAAIDELRRTRFSIQGRQDHTVSALQPQYHRGIPIDGLPSYMSSIWDQVQSNKDLDLPTQQDLLAQFRCDEIASQAIEVFDVATKPLRRPIESGKILPALHNDMKSAVSTAMKSFDHSASRYSPIVYQRKREDLLSKLHSAIEPLFVGTIKNLHRKAMEDFPGLLNELTTRGVPFGDALDQTQASSLSTFNEHAEQVVLEGSGWSFAEDLEVLKQDLEQLSIAKRAEELRRLMLSVERSFRKSINEPVELALSNPAADMWSNVYKAYLAASAKADSQFRSQASSFSGQNGDQALDTEQLERNNWLIFRSIVKAQTTDALILSRLRTSFEEKFRYDQSGIPKVWRKEDDIEGAFGTAKAETLAILPLFAGMKFPEEFQLPARTHLDANDPLSAEVDDEDGDTMQLFGEARETRLRNAFRRDVDTYFIEAKRGLVSGTAQIPVWVYGVVAVLGWNEFWAVLTNPLYFTLLLLGLVGAWFSIQMQLTGPIMSLSMTLGREVQRIATDKLREALHDNGRGEPAQAHHQPPASERAKRSPPEEIELKEL